MGVRSERELRVAERRAGRLFASVPLAGALTDGSARLHRPDLLLVPEGRGRPVAIEVELSLKGARRLEAILRAWGRCEGVDGVRYYAPPGVARAVARAVERVLVGDVVSISPLPADLLDKGGGDGFAVHRLRPVA